MALTVFFIAWWVPSSRLASIVLSLVAVLASFTEPLTICIIPLLIVRALINRGWARLPAVVATASIFAHFIFFVTPSSRGQVLGAGYLFTHPVWTFQQLMLRGPSASVLGSNLSKVSMRLIGSWLWLAGLAIVVVLILLTWVITQKRRPRAALFWLTFVWGLLVLSATMSFSSVDALDMNDWYTIGQTSRYQLSASLYIIPAVIAITALALSGSRNSRHHRLIRGACFALIGLLVVATAVDFPGDKTNYRGPAWQSTVEVTKQACSDRAVQSVQVQFTPEGTPTRWESTLPCSLFR